MNAEEIREMSIDEINVALDDGREELMRLRFQITSGELTDHNQLSQARQKVARLLTILRERQIESEKEGEA